ncbi:MAG TPA: AMP-binding protein, partial [Terriglobales bacterium]
MERRSLADCVGEFLQRGGEFAYVQRRGYRCERWTYRQIAEAAFQFARELNGRQIGKGERVLLWGPNSAEWVSAFFGCVLRGVIAVPIDDAAAPDFAVRIAQRVSAKLLLCSQKHSANAGSIPRLMLDDLRSTLGRHSSGPVSPSGIGGDDTLEIVFTSGTTAEPKGVVITHGNVLANIAPLEREIRSYQKYERFVHPIRFLNLLPLSHVFGQFLGMFLPQLMGGTVVFQESLKPAEIMATSRRERVSVLVCVPRVLQSLKEKMERDLQDEGRLKKFQQRFRAAEGQHFLRRWWIFRRLHRRLGWKFWAF